MDIYYNMRLTALANNRASLANEQKC